MGNKSGDIFDKPGPDCWPPLRGLVEAYFMHVNPDDYLSRTENYIRGWIEKHHECDGDWTSEWLPEETN